MNRSSPWLRVSVVGVAFGFAVDFAVGFAFGFVFDFPDY